MSEKLPTRVYVLGAGCSYHPQHGYPLATEFLPQLQAYSATIASKADCQRIKNAADDTVALLMQCQTAACHAATIDQLINLIWSNRCDDQLRAIYPQSTAHRMDLRY